MNLDTISLTHFHNSPHNPVQDPHTSRHNHLPRSLSFSQNAKAIRRSRNLTGDRRHRRRNRTPHHLSNIAAHSPETKSLPELAPSPEAHSRCFRINALVRSFGFPIFTRALLQETTYAINV
ncbi:hypothetical protein HanIR_Chr08g0369211 [Helianthus annuus]|nr:hypothetical protein HanIR_Chr08g0369211 [Helianthus annuus]